MKGSIASGWPPMYIYHVRESWGLNNLGNPVPGSLTLSPSPPFPLSGGGGGTSLLDSGVRATSQHGSLVTERGYSPIPPALLIARLFHSYVASGVGGKCTESTVTVVGKYFLNF